MLPDFDLIQPRTVDEALAALNDGAQPLAGGTNLLVDLRARRTKPKRLVSLAGLDALRGISRADGQVVVGALTTVDDLLRDPVIAEEAPALVASARVFAGAMVRNMATLAGNLCFGSPAADLAPPLLALDAQVVLRGPQGERTLPLAEFGLAPRATARAADELLTHVHWPQRPPGSAHLFRKVGLRKGDAISVVTVAVLLAAEGGKCNEVRIALGAVAPAVMRAPRAEAVLRGRTPGDESFAEVGRLAAEACNPIDDIRASAAYRRHVVAVATRRLAREAWAEISQGRP